MNEEISVTLRNNTNQIQPVNLFTEIFAIPQNLVGDGFWDISGESFFYSNLFSQLSYIQIDTTPITILTPYTTTSALSTLNADGVVQALNNLGQGTFTNNNNIISVVGLPNLYYGNIRITPAAIIEVNSNTISANPALQLVVNGTPFITLPSGVNAGGGTFDAFSGDSILINYQVGVLATNWTFTISWYQPNGIVTNLFSNSGVGAIVSSYSFTFPSTGNIYAFLDITP